MISHHDFLFEGGRIGVLLIHGLTGTPTEMRGIGREFHRAGLTVYGMQLAGHCGDVDDLIATNWRDWYHSVEECADKLRRQVDYLYVGGLSMGAVLALNYAADYPERVQGVLVYGATFRFDGWTIPTFSKIVGPWFLTLMDRLRLGRRRIFNEEPPYGIRNEQLRRKIAQSMLSGDSGAAGLAGNPWPSLSQLVYLTRHVRQALPKITSPCLVMHAENDDIAHRRNGELVRDRVSGPVNLVLLKNSYHMITIDNDRREVVSRSIAFMQQHVPAGGMAGGQSAAAANRRPGLNSSIQGA
ncbi:alpha/beta hydrolase [Martelella alba]|uniref:Alpha/beta fold hydrolase n=1 Tax=Martelella alba TaxID=2590451 RepID=A0ABY2SJ36_9HYPH|nr:alpha/beta fold hydrolase [Martelella alba]TKI04480.1 alpha/beta fold hydrolase [Martelella alba]